MYSGIKIFKEGLNKSKIGEIRVLYSMGESITFLAKYYGISEQAIRDVLKDIIE